MNTACTTLLAQWTGECCAHAHPMCLWDVSIQGRQGDFLGKICQAALFVSIETLQEIPCRPCWDKLCRPEVSLDLRWKYLVVFPTWKMSLLGLTAEIVKERQDTTFIMLVFKSQQGNIFCEKIYHFHNSLSWVKEKSRGRMRKYKLETDKIQPESIYLITDAMPSNHLISVNLRRSW